MLDAVDQERHVVGDHLDHRVGRLPAVLLDLRVVDPDLGLAGLALLAEAEMGERGAVEVQRVALEQIDGRHRPVVVADEGLGPLRLAVGELVVQLIDHPLEQIRLLVLQPGCHGRPPFRRPLSPVFKHRARRSYRPILNQG